MTNRGKNSNSYGNNLPIGIKKQVTLPERHWEFSKKCFDKYSEGIREMVRLAEVVINKNIKRFCDVHDIKDVSQTGIEEWLINEFPYLETSTPKNHIDLTREIIMGEANVIDHKRYISIVELDVVCPNVTDNHVVELKQVLSNGKERIRKHDDDSYYLPSEKAFVGESWKDVAERCLKEELGIQKYDVMIVQKRYTTTPPVSSYMGIDSVVTVERVMVMILKSEYKETYMEVQESKTTYFGWG